MKYNSINNKSHYSLLHSATKVPNLVESLAKQEYSNIVLCDNSFSGMIEHYESCQKFKAKPIFALDAGDFILLAHNHSGLKDIIRFHNGLRDNISNNVSIIIKKLNLNSSEETKEDIHLFRQHFSNSRIFLGLGINRIINDCYRSISNTYKIPTLPIGDSHYLNQKDKIDHKLMIAISQNTHCDKLQYQDLPQHILNNEEALTFYTDKEIQFGFEFLEEMEKFDITNKPRLPIFICPDGTDEREYLRILCRQGWKNKIVNIIEKEKYSIYADRVKQELSIINSTTILPSYFLIVQDYTAFAKKQGILVGIGRGSVGGSMVAFLIDITSIDPILYGTIFERFYNAGRNTEDHVSLPDIDMDFPIEHRETVIRYIKNKYGYQNVSNIVTFGTLKGRAAIKETLRLSTKLPLGEINSITKTIPDQAEISDELEEMKKEEGESSIIKWALENQAEEYNKYCRLENNEIVGEFADFFKQAIRLEGTKRTRSKHAAGVIISPVNLIENYPVRTDEKSGELTLDLEMNSAEAAGLPKFDILGVAALSKINNCQNMVRQL